MEKNEILELENFEPNLISEYRTTRLLLIMERRRRRMIGKGELSQEPTRQWNSHKNQQPNYNEPPPSPMKKEQKDDKTDKQQLASTHTKTQK